MTLTNGVCRDVTVSHTPAMIADEVGATIIIVDNLQSLWRTLTQLTVCSASLSALCQVSLHAPIFFLSHYTIKWISCLNLKENRFCAPHPSLGGTKGMTVEWWISVMRWLGIYSSRLTWTSRVARSVWLATSGIVENLICDGRVPFLQIFFHMISSFHL